tara:strand:+ start:855 stop:1073 length:219 start_codon:yes stop_codon:yes gene_type:complete
MGMSDADRLEYNRKYYVLRKAWRQGLLAEYPFGGGKQQKRKPKPPLQDPKQKGFTRTHAPEGKPFTVSFKHI